MQPNSVPDIYLMKREKSRAGCMTVLIATLVVGVIVAVVAFLHWRGTRGTETAEPVVFPDAPIEADIPPVHVPERPALVPPEPAVEEPAPEPAAAETPPAPAPEPAAPATEPAAGEPAAATPDAVPAEAPAPADAGEAAATLAQARQQFQAGNYQAARQTALDALAAAPGNPEVETFLSELAMPLLASQRPMAEKVDYTVQSGDYLGKLAATFNTPVALIAKANDIPGAMIRVGQTLRLLDGNEHTFALEISKSRNDLLVTLDGKFFKRYRVSTGKNAKTPTGTFKVIDKIARPAWHKPGGKPIPYGDPENLLGTHWLALDLPGYGIHGTWEPESIGSQTSDGCIRLLNEDVEELYTILPKGTLVTIIE